MKILLILITLLTIPQAHSGYTLGLGDITCGQEGQTRCPFFNKEFWLNGSGSCDRGLKSIKRICQKSKRDLLKNETHQWVSDTLKFQRELQSDLPINQMYILWGHNAFNNRADGYIFPNHKYSITDMLELGVRSLELDPHLVGKRIRLCHGKQTVIFGKNLHLVCSPFDRLFFNIIEEINIWLRKKENLNEVIVIKTQDETEGRSDLYRIPFEKHLGDLMLKRSDLDIPWGRYPTINEMRAVGKRILMTGGPLASGWSGGNRFNANTFDGKLCQRNGYNIDPTFNNGKSSNWSGLAADGTKYFRVYDGPKKTGTITPEMVKQAVECNVTRIEAEHVDVDHARNMVWTWAEGEPIDWDKENRCVYVDKNGGWHSEDCERKLPFACQSITNPGIWTVTYRVGTFKDGQEACNRETYDSKFGIPMNGWQNARLYINHGQDVWINFKN